MKIFATAFVLMISAIPHLASADPNFVDCLAYSGNVSYEQIDSIVLIKHGSNSNESRKISWNDIQHNSILDVEPGAKYSVAVLVNYPRQTTVYQEYLKVAFDNNGNHSIEEKEELYVSLDSTKFENHLIVGPFVALPAHLGHSHMRVSLSYNSVIGSSPCMRMTFGQRINFKLRNANSQQ